VSRRSDRWNLPCKLRPKEFQNSLAELDLLAAGYKAGGARKSANQARAQMDRKYLPRRDL
jgi:hypothetical protein